MEVLDATSAGLPEQIRQHTLDIAFLRSMPLLASDDSLLYESLWNDRLVAAIPAGHPLAKKKHITFDMLGDYPCLAFDQGDTASFYYAEEILSTNDYPRMIKANDRATMLNLMVGLNGYTICSGIICEELNGSDFKAVPYKGDEENPGAVMEIGYITRNNSTPGAIAEQYIEELKRYLKQL